MLKQQGLTLYSGSACLVFASTGATGAAAAEKRAELRAALASAAVLASKTTASRNCLIAQGMLVVVAVARF